MDSYEDSYSCGTIYSAYVDWASGTDAWCKSRSTNKSKELVSDYDISLGLFGLSYSFKFIKYLIIMD